MRNIILACLVVILSYSYNTTTNKYNSGDCVIDNSGAGLFVETVNRDKWVYTLKYLHGFESSKLIYLTGKNIEISIDSVDRDYEEMSFDECFNAIENTINNPPVGVK